MRKFKYLVILVGFAFIVQCTRTSKKIDKNVSEHSIDFGKITKTKVSEIISDYSFIHLETTVESLIGTINQIEISNNKITGKMGRKKLSILAKARTTTSAPTPT